MNLGSKQTGTLNSYTSICHALPLSASTIALPYLNHHSHLDSVSSYKEQWDKLRQSDYFGTWMTRSHQKPLQELPRLFLTIHQWRQERGQENWSTKCTHWFFDPASKWLSQRQCYYQLWTQDSLNTCNLRSDSFHNATPYLQLKWPKSPGNSCYRRKSSSRPAHLCSTHSCLT